MQELTTATEFVEWIAYLDMDVNAFHREDYYLAQIAAEVRRGRVKDPSRVRTEDLLIKFKFRSGWATPANNLETSKSFWLGSLGVKKEG